ncbi:hypothetical protein GUJ93_ZPchr0012g19238 [Zizania palustris]|uniref:Secreted protein n=1 Tax=Zizania palustris TaxID=103762 RepID=A0A8J6BV05_ZIZPA|nr:hypothetical protein GUJ93_ZPchr0012g19238 [Zizania palustris]
MSCAAVGVLFRLFGLYSSLESKALLDGGSSCLHGWLIILLGAGMDGPKEKVAYFVQQDKAAGNRILCPSPPPIVLCTCDLCRSV